MLEVKLRQRRDALRTKLPEIKNTLRAVQFLTRQKEKGENLKTHFQLADQVFSEADIDTTGKAGLWLGVCGISRFRLSFLLRNDSITTTTMMMNNNIGKCDG